MGVDGRPSTGWKYGANGAKNTRSSSSASTRANSSGSRSTSAGNRDSHSDGPSPIVRNMMTSIPSAQGVEVILPRATLTVTGPDAGFSGRSNYSAGARASFEPHRGKTQQAD